MIAAVCGVAVNSRFRVPRLACQAVCHFGEHGLASNPWHPAEHIPRYVAPYGFSAGPMRHSRMPPETSGWSFTSSLSSLVVTGANVTLLNASFAVP